MQAQTESQHCPPEKFSVAKKVAIACAAIIISTLLVGFGILIWKHAIKVDAFLVTFKGIDVADANSPEIMFKLAKTEQQVASNLSLEQFVSSGAYHNIRGEYVYKRIAEHHKATRQWLEENLPQSLIMSSIPISNSFTMKIPKKDLETLKQNAKILEIHTNDTFKVVLAVSKDSDSVSGRFATMKSKGDFQVQWNVAKIGADSVWKMSQDHGKGQGIVYAIADTGVDFKHYNINKNYIGRREDGSYDHNKAWWDGVRQRLGSWGVTKCGFASNVPCDDQGHGTHVTSIAVGADGYGVAPGARWMSCRNMDHGIGSPETYLSCLNFFLAPHDLDGKNADPKRRPHVVGNSYGCPDSEGCSKRAMTAAMEALRAAGVFMSVSAGNEGPNCSTISDPPALEKSVITVGATDSNDKLAPFSSRGPCVIGKESYLKPNVTAPGVGVLAAIPNDSFAFYSGTSMASPHVGGAVALITSMCPHLTGRVDKLQSLLERTAVKLLPPPSDKPLCGGDLPTSVPNNYFGHGRIDVLAAVRECQKMEL